MDITLKLTEKQMDLIANALGMRPYMEVAQLLQDISRQVQAQQRPETSAPIEVPKQANGSALQEAAS